MRIRLSDDRTHKQLSCMTLRRREHDKKYIARALVVWFLTSLAVFFRGVLTGFYARDLVIALIATARTWVNKTKPELVQTTKAEKKFSYRVEQSSFTLLILP